MKTTISVWVGIVAMFAMVLGVVAQEQTDAPEKPENVDSKPNEELPKPAKKPNQRVFGKSDEESFAGKVVIIKVGENDLINKQAFNFWRRVLKRVNEEKARAVVFELNTPGGLAMDTADLIMVQMQKLEVPSYAFVNQKALSAGALIASGTDAIYMHPVSAIGAAALVSGGGGEIPETMRAKIESAFNAFVRAVAKSKGRNPDVIRAMMITKEYYDFGEIQVEQGELLTLTADEACMEFEGKPLLAKGIVKSVEELLEKEGLGDVPVIVAEASGMEKFAYWVASFSGILILVGIGGAYLEMKTPGFGLGGGIALLAFGLFFFGNYAAGNMAGYGLMVLFLLGVILVAVEFFVLPGMILPGVLGASLVVGTLFVAMIDDFAFDDNSVRGWDAEQAWDFITKPTLNLALGLLGSVVLAFLMMRYLPSMPLFNRLVMGEELASGDAAKTDADTGENVGLQGVTTTDLRPAGKGEFDGQILDITAENGFISEGAKVKIVSEDGLRILVEEA